jgi:zinc protease
VLLSEDHRLPVVAAEVRYLVGSAHEQKGRSGFAHLFEHLMFQGSQHYDDEYFKPFEPIGGGGERHHHTDRTNFYEQVPSNYLELALWMQSDRMQRAAAGHDAGQARQPARRGEERAPAALREHALRRGLASPGLENLYPQGHPYQHTTIGSHEDLTAASMDDVKGFFRAVLRAVQRHPDRRGRLRHPTATKA